MVSLIGDDVLFEILSRISTPVLAIRCKLVCKHWCSLISNPYFISRFKQQHIKHQSRYPKPLLGMLVRRTVVNMADFDNDAEFNFDGFNLDYLPVKKNGNLDVVASCNDLLLCNAGESNFYLCNPFTRQWVVLPHPPQSRWPLHIMGTGLVFQPCEGSGTMDRYRIVRFYCDEDSGFVKVETYRSETSEWLQCDDLGEECYSDSNIAAYNGELVWADSEYLFRYDPFNMRLASLRLMNAPVVIRRRREDEDYYHVGVCEGVLRVLRLECRYPQSCTAKLGETVVFKDIRVWELHEEEDTRMVLKEHIVFDEGVYYHYDIDYIHRMGFHPRNKEVLFLVTEGFVSSFNTRTRQLKVESRFKESSQVLHLSAFTLQLPWWPTPIPHPSPTS